MVARCLVQVVSLHVEGLREVQVSKPNIGIEPVIRGLRAGMTREQPRFRLILPSLSAESRALAINILYGSSVGFAATATHINEEANVDLLYYSTVRNGSPSSK